MYYLATCMTSFYPCYYSNVYSTCGELYSSMWLEMWMWEYSKYSVPVMWALCGVLQWLCYKYPYGHKYLSSLRDLEGSLHKTSNWIWSDVHLYRMVYLCHTYQWADDCHVGTTLAQIIIWKLWHALIVMVNKHVSAHYTVIFISLHHLIYRQPARYIGRILSLWTRSCYFN